MASRLERHAAPAARNPVRLFRKADEKPVFRPVEAAAGGQAGRRPGGGGTPRSWPPRPARFRNFSLFSFCTPPPPGLIRCPVDIFGMEPGQVPAIMVDGTLYWDASTTSVIRPEEEAGVRFSTSYTDGEPHAGPHPPPLWRSRRSYRCSDGSARSPKPAPPRSWPPRAAAIAFSWAAGGQSS